MNHSGEFDWGKTIKFFTDAPVIQKIKGKLELIQKVFASSPMPNSRLSGIGNQTDGTDKQDEGEIQLKQIYEMTRWKEAFAKHPIVIPMSGFTEFAYWRAEAGTAQNFQIPKSEVMFAAGIAMKPFTPKGEKDSGFSILTHTATKQMMDYHHRLIVLLRPEDAKTYLEEMSPEERFDFLVANRFTGKLEVSQIRNMAKGWEKRVPQQLSKKEREEKYRAVLNKENVGA